MSYSDDPFCVRCGQPTYFHVCDDCYAGFVEDGPQPPADEYRQWLAETDGQNCYYHPASPVAECGCSQPGDTQPVDTVHTSSRPVPSPAAIRAHEEYRRVLLALATDLVIFGYADDHHVDVEDLALYYGYSESVVNNDIEAQVRLLNLLSA